MPNENDAPSWRFFVADIDSEGGRAMRRVLTMNGLTYEPWGRHASPSGEQAPEKPAAPVGIFIPLIGTSLSYDALRGVLSDARAVGVTRAVIIAPFVATPLIAIAERATADGLPTLLIASSQEELIGCERGGDPLNSLVLLMSQLRGKKVKRFEMGFAEDARFRITYIDDLMRAALFAMNQDTSTEPILVRGIEFKCGDVVREVVSLMKCKVKINYGKNKIVNPSVYERNNKDGDLVMFDELPERELRRMTGGPRILFPQVLAELARRRTAKGIGKISACVIMRDSEEDIGDCLASLVGVDEIIVVDTGSVDKSIEIAKKYTDKIFHFKWIDDFAAAKNFALSKATGEWVVFIDSDESFTPDTRDEVRHVTEDYSYIGGPDALQVRRINIDMRGNVATEEDYSVRIFRNGNKFVGAVHEYVSHMDGSLVIGGTVPRERLRINHTGYAPERMREKIERDKHIITRTEEKGGEVNFANFYHARLALREGKWAEVIKYAKRSVEKDTKTLAAMKFEPYRFWYKAAMRLGDEDEMLAAREAMRRDMPTMPDSYALEGVELWNRGEEDEAAPLLMKALELDEKFLSENPAENDKIKRDVGQIAEQLAEYYEKKGDTDAVAKVRKLGTRK